MRSRIEVRQSGALCVLALLVSCTRGTDRSPDPSGTDLRSDPSDQGMTPAGQSGSAAPSEMNAAPSGTPSGLPSPLCDGSDGIRLELSISHGAFSGLDAAFLSELGSTFAFVDGHCGYVAGAQSLDGIHTGVLDEATARALAQEIGFAQLETWEAEWADATKAVCPDAGGSYIRSPSATLECSCQCGGQAPPGLEAAMDAQEQWLKRLNEEGSAPQGPVRVVARAEPTGSGWPESTFVPWTMSWPISDALVLRDEPLAGDAGVLIEDEGEVAQLRALREQARALRPIAPDILVRESDTVWYRVFVRDELPASFFEAVQEFRAASQ